MNCPVCPACNKEVCNPLEFVDVTEQHRDYAPQKYESQLALNNAAAATALQYQMFKCGQCGMEFADPMRAPTAQWYELVYRGLCLFPTDRWEFGEVLRRIGKGEHLFEFGCGSPGRFSTYVGKLEYRHRVWIFPQMQSPAAFQKGSM